MFVLWASLNRCHPTTALCVQGAKQKNPRLEEDEARAGAETSLQAYGWTLETVISFKYLKRLITKTEDDWPEVIVNLQEARRSWSRILWILGREGADAQTSIFFCLVILQDVLLYGTDTSFMSLLIKRLRGYYTTGWRGGFWGNGNGSRRKGPGNTPLYRRLYGR